MLLEYASIASLFFNHCEYFVNVLLTVEGYHVFLYDRWAKGHYSPKAHGGFILFFQYYFINHGSNLLWNRTSPVSELITAKPKR